LNIHGFPATIIRPEEAMPGTLASGHARRTPAPVLSRPAIMNAATIPVIGKAANGTGIAMTTSAPSATSTSGGSAQITGCTEVGTSSATTEVTATKKLHELMIYQD